MITRASDVSDLFEERALLLCRLGRHEAALAIYAHVMKEPEMAEELVAHHVTTCLLYECPSLGTVGRTSIWTKTAKK